MLSDQLTEGELSLKSDTFFLLRLGQTDSITSHNIRRPAISRSEMDRVPDRFATVLRLAVMSGGHSPLKTVGERGIFSVVVKVKDIVLLLVNERDNPIPN